MHERMSREERKHGELWGVSTNVAVAIAYELTFCIIAFLLQIDDGASGKEND